MFWANNMRQGSRFYADELREIYAALRSEFSRRGVAELKIDPQAGGGKGFEYDIYNGLRVKPDYLVDMLSLLQKNGFNYTFLTPTSYMISIPDNLLLIPTHYNW